MSEKPVKVWDLLVRAGHWVLVIAFCVSYFTEGEVMPAHAIAGYTIGSVVLIRIVWGFVGSAHARFTDFVRSPKSTFAYIRTAVRGSAKRYLGHNPAGGAMVIALLVCLLSTVTCGLVLYGLEENAGPLAGWVNGQGFDEDIWEEAHELFANTTLFLIGLHVAGVIHASYVHRENLIKSMFTGRKRPLGD